MGRPIVGYDLEKKLRLDIVVRIGGKMGDIKKRWRGRLGHGL